MRVTITLNPRWLTKANHLGQLLNIRPGSGPRGRFTPDTNLSELLRFLIDERYAALVGKAALEEPDEGQGAFL